MLDSLTLTLFNLTPAGAMLLRPCYDGSQLVDFAYELLNLAGQHMLQLPAQPAETFLQRYPMAVESGVFAFYRDTFLSGKTDFYGVDYRFEGLDAYYQLAAQRDGEVLVVTFTDTADRRQGDMVAAMQRSHLQEQQAQAELAVQRRQLAQLNEELALTNKELQASNAEYQQANTDLGEAQQYLRQFNQELETRVEARTYQALAMQATLLATAQAQVRTRETFYQMFTETTAAVCIQRGPTHVYEYVNQAYQSFFAGRQLLGRPSAEALPEAVANGLVARLDLVYQTGETYYGQEVPLLLTQPQGLPQQLYFTFSYQAYYEEGKIAGIATLAYDVSEQVYARQQVQRLNEELAATNQALLATNEELQRTNRQLTRTNVDLDTFIYTASHDLKAPITNIEGLVQVLRQELGAALPNPATTAHLLDLMTDSVGRFQKTIGHLTELTELQAIGQQQQSHELLVLAELLEELRLDLAPSLEAAQAQLLLDVATCPPLRVSPKDLRSIFFNLLSNALKYRAPERTPVVRVHAACDAQWVSLQVQDNGLGLSPAQQANLFKLFQRQHTHVEGAGVGLYAIKRLINNAGGFITVESELGVGSTFTIRLPRPA